MAAEGPSKKSRRQSGEPALHVDHFPLLERFNPPEKLPSYCSIIARMRMLSAGGRSQMTSDKAAVEVAKEVIYKYYRDTIYCHQ